MASCISSIKAIPLLKSSITFFLLDSNLDTFTPSSPIIFIIPSFSVRGTLVLFNIDCSVFALFAVVLLGTEAANAVARRAETERSLAERLNDLLTGLRLDDAELRLDDAELRLDDAELRLDDAELRLDNADALPNAAITLLSAMGPTLLQVSFLNIVRCVNVLQGLLSPSL